ncbi:uncharacterized protein LOC113218339 isoform X2 [Frankliniella occidentalis]|uniref:Uncharacterized protein LOC113218339 isoform X2 n=1 Tax=Frankliniella occidentalis TaxID=133901 RepID=A0A9C6TTD9_FRAOC|nr:uncharacterized protein LOC113218339 isoform X2 [Frankliniella occidentalis]
MQSVMLDQLPDDVLLEVMQHLDLPALFTCRLVCKRLGFLALHPCAWRRRRVDYGLRRWTCPVLRLAPCLESLELRVSSPGCHKLLSASTKCRVSELELDVESRRAASHACRIIRNQDDIGGLWGLTVVFKNCAPGDEAAALLAAASLCGPEELIVNFFGYKSGPSRTSRTSVDSPVVHDTESRSPLKRFSASCFCPQLEPVCNSILATHAHTLEQVLVGSAKVESASGGTSYMTSVAPLLAGMPNLQDLECPLLPGLEAVAACDSITRVFLDMVPNTARAVRSAAEFLRRAKHLRDVTLEYCGHLDGHLGVDLVLALASGRSRATVESLTFYLGDLVDVLLPSLLRALPSLPALRLLEVDDDSDELLLGITPDTVPVLESLRILNFGYSPCAHRWLHRDSVNVLLSANPSLLLCPSYSDMFCPIDSGDEANDSDSSSDSFDVTPCKACAMGCHQGLLDNIVLENIERQTVSSWTPLPRGVPQ